MKWVKCIKKQSYISEGKVYKVLESYNDFSAGLTVKINDNYDNDSYFVMRDQFEDVTLEVERERKLNKLLGTIMSNSQYPYRYGNHIEDRGSMVNFSIVGRDCTQEQRDDFFGKNVSYRNYQRIVDYNQTLFYQKSNDSLSRTSARNESGLPRTSHAKT